MTTKRARLRKGTSHAPTKAKGKSRRARKVATAKHLANANTTAVPAKEKKAKKQAARKPKKVVAKKSAAKKAVKKAAKKAASKK